MTITDTMTTAEQSCNRAYFAGVARRVQDATYGAIEDRITALGYSWDEGREIHETAYQAAARGATDEQVHAHVARAEAARDLINPEIIDRYSACCHMATVNAGRATFHVYGDGEVGLDAEDGPMDVAELATALGVVQDVLALMEHDGALPYV